MPSSAMLDQMAEEPRDPVVPDVRDRLQQAARALVPEDIAIDCGANIGAITKKLASRGCIVHAFEPDPAAFERLKERFEDRENVVLHNAAVGSENTTAKLFFHVNRENLADDFTVTQTSSLLGDKSNVAQDDYVEVEVIDLCSFIEELERPVALLKMDIEGAEADVLRALIDRGLIERIKVAFVETHEHRVPSIVEPMARIRQDLDRAGASHIHLDWI